jgi:hypothetical protein
MIKGLSPEILSFEKKKTAPRDFNLRDGILPTGAALHVGCMSAWYEYNSIIVYLTYVSMATVLVMIWLPISVWISRAAESAFQCYRTAGIVKKGH